jgi:hypothetical protein
VIIADAHEIEVSQTGFYATRALSKKMPDRTLHMDAALNPALLVLILVADFAITLLHSYQEWKGVGAPLWRNFGAIVGLDIPDWFGFPGFTVGLSLALLTTGFVGFTGLLGPGVTAFALGALIGARLSDTLISHVLLHGVGYRPNPGLSSTPLYVLEALFIFVVFKARLEVAPGCAKLGLALGVLAFLSVLPLLLVLRWIVPAWSRPRWQRWQPLPPWASTNA